MHIADADLQQLLTTSGQVTAKQLEGVLASRKDPKQSLQSLVVEQKLITESDLLKLCAKYAGVSFTALAGQKIPPETLKKLPERIARKYQAVVFGFEENQYQVALTEPTNKPTIEFLSKQLGGPVKPYLAVTAEIMSTLDQYKAAPVTPTPKAIKSPTAPAATGPKASSKDSPDDAPIAKTVNVILEYAVKSGASDIHLEPRETFVQVRYRIDGVLRESMTLPGSILPAVISRIKHLSGLKVDEHRIPQDGRFKFAMGSQTVALRVSTLPVMDGEKAVMRILNESTHALTLQELGFTGYSLEIVTSNLHKPHGLTLVTGPAGSGKSTTLYSILSMLNTPGVNISTVEDPVEYRIPGVNQTQVHPQGGMTFATGLRALLRQDPNVIMVGEIRDGETADLAVQASLTGHVVLSTLHTANAAGALARLRDMGLEPFLLASTINTVIGQRLVRKLCQKCRVPFVPEGHELDGIKRDFQLDSALKHYRAVLEGRTDNSGIPEAPSITEPEINSRDHHKDKVIEPLEEIERKSILDKIAADPNIINRSASEMAPAADLIVTSPAALSPAASATDLKPGQFMLYRLGPGCSACGGAGYNGRLGIFEVLENSATISKMITSQATSEDLEDGAVHGGMLTMQQDGLVKALMGLTTLEEVVRVTRE